MTEKVIIAGLELPNQDLDYAMEELSALVEANNMEATEKVIQKLERPNPATYFGTGKVTELHELGTATDVQTLVVNAELSPSQIRNLEQESKLSVIDRTGLILEIFANRAQSREAKLQVEIAKLNYQMPRLRTSSSQRLDQQSAGDAGGGYTNRGAGETKLEMSRRTIQQRINNLTHELKEMTTSTAVQRKKRDQAGLPSVALVGYTNAGKSTTMNGLVRMYGKNDEKQVFEKNMLFATLDTSVRQLTFPDQKQLLLSDTVGFVSNLPHQLIKAFRSTLAEAAQADLLVQVVDISDPHFREMIETTNETLQEIGVTKVPMIVAFNKADLADVTYPNFESTDELIYSARDKRSLVMLANMIKQKVFTGYREATFLIPFDQGQVVDYLNQHTNVLKTDYKETGTEITTELSSEDYHRYENYLVAGTVE
ncbi:GTPase HflX [Pediococcus siamensis]|uniref:GTPase HflX n=1 Tax=Pediococcus siamensis TaxID=381829 RepID=UPI00399F118B